MALGEFILIIIIVNNLSSSLQQILTQREFFPRLYLELVASAELHQHFVALNHSCDPKGLRFAFGKRLD